MSIFSIEAKNNTAKKIHLLLSENGFEIISLVSPKSEDAEPAFIFSVMAPQSRRIHPEEILKNDIDSENYRIKENLGIFEDSAFDIHISKRVDNSEILDYTSNRVLNVIKQDSINTVEKIKNLPLIQNRLGLVSDGNGYDLRQSSVMNMERDAVILSKFSGINGVPVFINSKNEDDFIRNTAALADNFFALRISGITKQYDEDEFARITNAVDIPVIFNDTMERAPAIAAVVANSLKRIDRSFSGKNVAIIGISTMAEMLVNLLKYLGFDRVYGIDSDPGMLSKFERGEGIVATMEQAYVNSDVIIVMPDLKLVLDEKRLNHRQIIISFSNSCVNKQKLPSSVLKNSFFGYDPNPFYTLPGLMTFIKKTGYRDFDKNFSIRVMKSLLLKGDEGMLLPRPNNTFIQNQVRFLGLE